MTFSGVLVAPSFLRVVCRYTEKLPSFIFVSSSKVGIHNNILCAGKDRRYVNSSMFSVVSCAVRSRVGSVSGHSGMIVSEVLANLMESCSMIYRIG